MADKDVEDLVRQVTARGSGWTRATQKDGNGHIRLLAPGGGFVTLPTSPSDPHWRANALADLKRNGWNPDDIEAERKRISRQRATEEIKRAQLAAQRAQERENARQAAVQLLKEANTEAAPLAGSVLVGYPTEARYVTVDEIRAAVDLNRENRCNTRPLYKEWVRQWRNIMARGAWHLSPEAIVFDEHGCMVDGMHRGTAYLELAEREPEVLSEYYPYGMPFTVVSGFPSALVQILNSGKARSPKDILAVEGVTKNSYQLAAALRLLVAYDDFQAGTGVPWPQWNSLKMDADEMAIAIKGPYVRLPEFGPASSLLRRKIRMAPAASYALPFLLDREGHDPAAAEEFLAGLRMEVDTRVGDPRATLGMALLRRLPSRSAAGNARRGAISANSEAQRVPGAHQLCMGLKAYFKWMTNEEWRVADFGVNEKAYAVWQPGMKLIKGEVRYPYRDF
jgi:hypothetical protein